MLPGRLQTLIAAAQWPWPSPYPVCPLVSYLWEVLTSALPVLPVGTEGEQVGSVQSWSRPPSFPVLSCSQQPRA